MVRATLTHSELRAAFDRVLQGEKISHVASSLSVDGATLAQRFKRRFPAEYEQAKQRRIIVTAGAKSTYTKKTEQLAHDPAVQAYLQEKGTYQEIATQFGIPLMTLYNRVQRVLKLQKERAESLLPKS